MEESVKILKLYRKSMGGSNNNLLNQPDSKENSIQQGTSGSREKEGQRDKSLDTTYFATDYFDVLDVEEKTMKDGFSSIMGLEETGDEKSRETAMQSYALYCSDSMIRYEKNLKRDGHLNDPFGRMEDMPFLSVIQVHITPEVLRRMQYHVEALWEKIDGADDNIILKPFLEDLCSILCQYIDLHYEGKFVCRVYHVLSAGDFAVVVKSASPVTSYEISTLIRRRTLTEEGGSRNWVVYKTYTLLTMIDCVITEEESGQSDNCFVVRGCYSNKYWSERDDLEERKEVDGLFHLNGRYDFSIRMKENVFAQLLPVIKKYKMGCPVEKKGEGTEGCDPVVDYLTFLMENEYLSYLNERYLLSDSVMRGDGKEPEPSGSLSLRAVTEPDRDLESLIRHTIDQLLNNYENFEAKLDGYENFRSSIPLYMKLLKKQIQLCYTINELSDTRIYARVLAEQLGIALDSAENYLELIKQGQDSYAQWNLMEEHLSEAVHALDHYAQYIRNNNLQSLQTPNYNIESSMGMEKILIGYSEFLYSFVEFYQETFINAKKSILPVVVPDMRQMGATVEVLFPEGNGADWQTERKLLSDNAKTRRFLAVICYPTFTQLSDIPSMFTTIFHEIAHQLRYESRWQRNNSLLRAVIEKCFSATVPNVLRTLNEGIELYDGNYAFTDVILSAFTSSVLKGFFSDDSSQEENRKEEEDTAVPPLNSFSRSLFEQLDMVGRVLKYVFQWEEELKHFVNEISFDGVCEDDEFNKLVVKLSDCWEYIVLAESETDFDEYLDKAIKYAYVLAWYGVYYTLGETEREAIERIGVEAWIIGGKLPHDLSLKEFWDSSFAGLHEPVIDRNYRAFYVLYVWLVAEMEKQCLIGRQKGVQEDVFEDMYAFAREKWSRYCEETKSLYFEVRDAGCGKEFKSAIKTEQIPFYSTWTKLGRQLGIDAPGNIEKFKKIIMTQLQINCEDGNVLISKYREETADLLMCSVIPLNSFGYVHLMVNNIPSDNRYDDVYIERISHIIFEKWCGGKENPQYAQEFRKCCTDIMHKMKHYCERCFELQISDFRDDAGDTEDLLKRLKNNLYSMENESWEDDEENTLDRLTFLLDKTQTDLEKVRKGITFCKKVDQEQKNGQDEQRVKRMLGNASRMCKIVSSMVDNGFLYIDALAQYEELEADYRRGVNNLSVLNSQMKKKGGQIAALAEFCDCIAAYFNGSCDEETAFSELNTKGMEFLLRMFYTNKIRNAQNAFKEGAGNEN